MGDNSNFKMNIFAKIKTIISNITIEPAMFLIMFTSHLDHIAHSQMVLDKCCKIDFGYNDTVCDNLVTDFKEQNKQVQDEVAQFKVYETLLDSVFPAFFAFYLGAWADLFGRKLLFYIFLSGIIIRQCIVIICAYFMDSRKEFLLLAGLPSSFAGGHAAFGLAITTFLTDITHPDYRALRHGIMHLAAGCARPISTIVGAYLFDTGGYLCVFSTSLVGIIIASVYLILRIRGYKWKPSKNTKQRNAFSPMLVKDSFVATFKPRLGPNRKYIMVMILITMFTILPFSAERSIAFNYVRTRYEWELDKYSQYSSIVSATSIAGKLHHMLVL